MTRYSLVLLLAACSATGTSDGFHPSISSTTQADEGQGCNPDCPGCLGSPIVVDVAGDGYNLTDAGNGVIFDIKGQGHGARIAWTSSGSDDAWLALDRNENGVVDDGTELFGNYTDQPVSDNPNGFLALAVFDLNGDGVIDANDEVFSSLRLWRDVNHDGLSQPEELHTLAEFGIQSFSLAYGTSDQVDPNGNLFRYGAPITVADGSTVAPYVYDVYLTTVPVGQKTPIRDILRANQTDMCPVPPKKTWWKCAAHCWTIPLWASTDPNVQENWWQCGFAPWPYQWTGFGAESLTKTGAESNAQAACVGIQLALLDFCDPTDKNGVTVAQGGSVVPWVATCSSSIH